MLCDNNYNDFVFGSCIKITFRTSLEWVLKYTRWMILCTDSLPCARMHCRVKRLVLSMCVCVCDQNTPSADRLLDLCLSISLALCLQWLLKIITAHTCPQIGRCVVTPTRNLEFDGVYWQWLTGWRSLIIFQCCLSVAYSPLISLRWWVHINYAYYSYAR